ncbi:MAG: hypothetical protein AMS23_09105 [Bacteroides sp. SM1_62]|nr:MAG: hypothetical protein AMS26_07555 [Bacteroides sp. SM23_62]KPL21572.1 MAG: hypothetical protein AMS23_09105 [Bacteroides sp. SM1_62]
MYLHQQIAFQWSLEQWYNQDFLMQFFFNAFCEVLDMICLGFLGLIIQEQDDFVNSIGSQISFN